MPKYTRVRYWRARRLLSQKELAERADVSELTISNIERGHKPRPRTARQLVEALDIQPEDLYTDDPQEADTPIESRVA